MATGVPKQLIVGLGNPGSTYENTRHNIGFVVVDALARSMNIEMQSTLQRGFFDRVRRRPGRTAQGAHTLGIGRYRGRNFGLLKPLTYMNESGEALAPVMRRLKLQPSDILVVLDDINLPLGAIRIRPRGSDGGHNGLKSIIRRINSENFPRMRLGVGSNFGRGHQARYVLSSFDEEEQPVVAETITQACKAAQCFVTQGIETSMNRYNRKRGPLSDD